MSERYNAFIDAFSSWGIDEADREQLWALADYTTNTLRIYVPVDNPVKMTLVHAFVSREEFMHGEWDVAIVHSCARLRLVAIERFYNLLEDDPEDPTARLREIRHIWLAAQKIDQALEPFQEAVDKIQILSVVSGDEPFYETIQEIFERVFDEDSIEKYWGGNQSELKELLEQKVEEQKDIATGKEEINLNDREHIYVNPLYTYALYEVATPTEEISENESLDLEHLSLGRDVIDAIARVTLDIPYPIIPRESDISSDELEVEDVDVDSLRPADLEQLAGNTARYNVSDDDLEEYLLTHIDKIQNDSIREQLGTTVDEYNDTWIDHVFVATLKEFERLQQEGNLPDDSRILRGELSESVHGIDTSKTDKKTMADKSTPLLEIPSEKSSGIDTAKYIQKEGNPLAKVVVEAFEQHGSFGALVFRPTESMNERQMNFHAVMDTDTDIQSRGLVPEGASSYQQLWNRYFLGKELLNTLFRQYGEYREHLVDAFVATYDSKVDLAAALERVDFGTSSEKEAHVQTSAGMTAIDYNVKRADNTLDKAKGNRSENKMRELLKNWHTWDLLQAADDLDIEFQPIDSCDALSRFECPLCDLVTEPCGGEDCVVDSLGQTFNEKSPECLETLYRINSKTNGMN